MKQIFIIIYTQLEFSFKAMKRYWINTLSEILQLSLLLVFMFMGVDAFKNYSVSENIIYVKKIQYAIGVFIYIMTFSNFYNLANLVAESKNSGKLEQMIINPYGSGFLLLIEGFGNTIFLFTISVIGLGTIMVIYKVYTQANIFLILPLIFPIILTAFGLSYVFAGLTFIFKKIASLISLIQYLIVALMVLPSYPFNLFSLLPVGAESNVIIKYFSGMINHISYKWWLYLYLHGFFYFILGLFVYKYCENYAKEKGILGHD